MLATSVLTFTTAARITLSTASNAVSSILSSASFAVVIATFIFVAMSERAEAFPAPSAAVEASEKSSPLPTRSTTSSETACKAALKALSASRPAPCAAAVIAVKTVPTCCETASTVAAMLSSMFASEYGLKVRRDSPSSSRPKTVLTSASVSPPSCIKVDAIETTVAPASAESLTPDRTVPLEVSIVASSVRTTITAFSFPASPVSVKYPVASVRVPGSVSSSHSPSPS